MITGICGPSGCSTSECPQQLRGLRHAACSLPWFSRRVSLTLKVLFYEGEIHSEQHSTAPKADSSESCSIVPSGSLRVSRAPDRKRALKLPSLPHNGEELLRTVRRGERTKAGQASVCDFDRENA